MIWLFYDGEFMFVCVLCCVLFGVFFVMVCVWSVLMKFLCVIEDFDVFEVWWDGGEGDGWVLVFGTAVGTCADGARCCLDDVYGVVLCVVNGREWLDVLDVVVDDGWGWMEWECWYAFFNGLKEVTYVTRASAARAMMMLSEDVDVMWDVVVCGDVDMLCRVEKVGDVVWEGRKWVVVFVRVYETRGDDFANATFASVLVSVEWWGMMVGDVLCVFGVDVDVVEIVFV